MISGISVQDLRKADPHTATKLSVVVGPSLLEDESILWAVGQVARAIRSHGGELEIAQIFLSSYNIVPGASSDPNSSEFFPDDQFPSIWEALKSSDIVLWGLWSCFGIPDHRTTLLLERLKLHCDRQVKNGKSPRLFNKGVAGVVSVGEFQAESAGVTAAMALNRLGLAVPCDGVVCWNTLVGKMQKSEFFANRLELLASNLLS